MTRYIVVSLVSGILFGLMDGIIHGNPCAQRLLEVYRPISRDSINIPAGLLIDLLYGFALAAIFLLLYQSLPGTSGLVKGISFAVLVWFLRVAMNVAAGWMMFRVPGTTLLYTLVTGLLEMLVLGILYGLTLVPSGTEAG